MVSYKICSNIKDEKGIRKITADDKNCRNIYKLYKILDYIVFYY